MIIEVHGEDEATEYAAQLLAAMVDIGKLPQFVDEAEHRPSSERGSVEW